MDTRSIEVPRLAPAMLVPSLLCLASLAGLVGLAGSASAQLSISRFTVDGGGGASTGGVFSVGGTIGQPDAGQMTGGSFALAGGFWAGGGGVVSGIEDGENGDDGDDANDGEGEDDVNTPTAPPLVFQVYPPSPNPVASRMLLAFDLPEASLVQAAVYDASGRLVRVLADGTLPAGKHQRDWNRRDQAGASVPAGIYFLRLDAGTHRDQRKIVVLH